MNQLFIELFNFIQDPEKYSFEVSKLAELEKLDFDKEFRAIDPLKRRFFRLQSRQESLPDELASFRSPQEFTSFVSLIESIAKKSPAIALSDCILDKIIVGTLYSASPKIVFDALHRAEYLEQTHVKEWLKQFAPVVRDELLESLMPLSRQQLLSLRDAVIGAWQNEPDKLIIYLEVLRAKNSPAVDILKAGFFQQLITLNYFDLDNPNGSYRAFIQQLESNVDLVEIFNLAKLYHFEISGRGVYRNLIGEKIEAALPKKSLIVEDTKAISFADEHIEKLYQLLGSQYLILLILCGEREVVRKKFKTLSENEKVHFLQLIPTSDRTNPLYYVTMTDIVDKECILQLLNHKKWIICHFLTKRFSFSTADLMPFMANLEELEMDTNLHRISYLFAGLRLIPDVVQNKILDLYLKSQVSEYETEAFFCKHCKIVIAENKLNELALSLQKSFPSATRPLNQDDLYFILDTWSGLLSKFNKLNDMYEKRFNSFKDFPQTKYHLFSQIMAYQIVHFPDEFKLETMLDMFYPPPDVRLDERIRLLDTIEESPLLKEKVDELKRLDSEFAIRYAMHQNWWQEIIDKIYVDEEQKDPIIEKMKDDIFLTASNAGLIDVVGWLLSSNYYPSQEIIDEVLKNKIASGDKDFILLLVDNQPGYTLESILDKYSDEEKFKLIHSCFPDITRIDDVLVHCGKHQDIILKYFQFDLLNNRQFEAIETLLKNPNFKPQADFIDALLRTISKEDMWLSRWTKEIYPSILHPAIAIEGPNQASQTVIEEVLMNQVDYSEGKVLEWILASAHHKPSQACLHYLLENFKSHDIFKALKLIIDRPEDNRISQEIYDQYFLQCIENSMYGIFKAIMSYAYLPSLSSFEQALELICNLKQSALCSYGHERMFNQILPLLKRQGCDDAINRALLKAVKNSHYKLIEAILAIHMPNEEVMHHAIRCGVENDAHPCLRKIFHVLAPQSDMFHFFIEQLIEKNETYFLAGLVSGLNKHQREEVIEHTLKYSPTSDFLKYLNQQYPDEMVLALFQFPEKYPTPDIQLDYEQRIKFNLLLVVSKLMHAETEHSKLMPYIRRMQDYIIHQNCKSIPTNKDKILAFLLGICEQDPHKNFFFYAKSAQVLLEACKTHHLCDALPLAQKFKSLDDLDQKIEEISSSLPKSSHP